MLHDESLKYKEKASETHKNNTDNDHFGFEDLNSHNAGNDIKSIPNQPKMIKRKSSKRKSQRKGETDIDKESEYEESEFEEEDEEIEESEESEEESSSADQSSSEYTESENTESEVSEYSSTYNMSESELSDSLKFDKTKRLDDTNFKFNYLIPDEEVKVQPNTTIPTDDDVRVTYMRKKPSDYKIQDSDHLDNANLGATRVIDSNISLIDSLIEAETNKEASFKQPKQKNKKSKVKKGNTNSKSKKSSRTNLNTNIKLSNLETETKSAKGKNKAEEVKGGTTIKTFSTGKI